MGKNETVPINKLTEHFNFSVTVGARVCNYCKCLVNSLLEDMQAHLEVCNAFRK